MTQDSNWGCPEHIDDESDMAFAERYANRLRESGYPWGHDCETALHVAVAEVERLRAELEDLRRSIPTMPDDVRMLFEKGLCTPGEAGLVVENKRLREENVQLAEARDYAIRANKPALDLSRDRRDETERLRAENAAYVKEIERLRVARDAIKASWATERAAIEAQRQTADKLKLIVVEMQLDGAMDELDWFRRLYSEVVDALKGNDFDCKNDIEQFLLAEPKPGEGTKP